MSDGVYIIIPEWTLGVVGRECAMLYGLVVGLSAKQDYCFASNEYLADRLHITTRAVQKQLAKLEAAGLILKKSGFRGTRLLYPASPSLKEAEVHPRDDGAGVKQRTLVREATNAGSCPSYIKDQSKDNTKKEGVTSETKEDDLTYTFQDLPKTKVTLTKTQRATLNEEWFPGCVDSLIRDLAEWGENNPAKFKQRKSHYLTLRTFYRNKEAKGLCWFNNGKGEFGGSWMTVDEMRVAMQELNAEKYKCA